MSIEMDEDDDFYAPEEPVITPAQPAPAAEKQVVAKVEDEGLEEGEEEDEGGAMDEDEDDSDIDIITERKDGTKAAPPSQAKYSEIRNIPQRTAATADAPAKSAPVKKEDSAKLAEQAPAPKSNFDAYAIPTHKPTGKPLTQVNIDEDLGEDAAPWRKPGTDISDYFNYGFDEFSWTVYAQKQTQLRSEYSQEAMSQNSKKMMEDLNNMMMMGGMPPGMTMPGMPGANGAGPGAAPGMGAMPGLDGIPPEMQAMMQQMMASGMDPSQIDPATMFAAMQGGAGGGGSGAGGGGQGGQNQNFGGSGFGGNQGQGYGYDQQQGMGSGRGGFGGRGRGGRRNW